MKKKLATIAMAVGVVVVTPTFQSIFYILYSLLMNLFGYKQPE